MAEHKKQVNTGRGRPRKPPNNIPNRIQQHAPQLLDRTSPTTSSLLRNLTEIQVVKKTKDPPVQRRTVQTTPATVSIVPDSKRAAPLSVVHSESLVISFAKNEPINFCIHCSLPRKPKYKVANKNTKVFICTDDCLKYYKQALGGKPPTSSESISFVEDALDASNSENPTNKFIVGKNCSNCEKAVLGEELNLSWEVLEFCNESCLAQYQKTIGSNCTYCQKQVYDMSLGKYCVRFGYNIKQFCSNVCLEEFKKGLKLCSYCQKDISGEEGFLAPVGDKAQFKEFCTRLCMAKYDSMINKCLLPVKDANTTCVVCCVEKPVAIEFIQGCNVFSFCGSHCFIAYKFVNNVDPVKCILCQKHYDSKIFTKYSAYVDDVYCKFCSRGCLNIYLITFRKIVCCSWCKVRKYNFDMILRRGDNGQTLKLCSLSCLSLYQVSLNDSLPTSRVDCANCRKNARPLYHLKMVNGSINDFCSYACVMSYQNSFGVTKGALVSSQGHLNAVIRPEKRATPDTMTMPIITSVKSLAPVNGPSTSGTKPRKRTYKNSKVLPPSSRLQSPPKPPTPPPQASPSPSPPATPPSPVIETRIRHQFIIKAPSPPPQRNMATMCSIVGCSVEVSCVPETASMYIQTEPVPEKTCLITLPVPIYVPVPMLAYSAPYPVPVPFPLSLPIPLFIPTTKNAAVGIMKEIEKTKIEMPTDPLEAELLTMAELVAGDKKDDPGCLKATQATSTEAVEMDMPFLEPAIPNVSILNEHANTSEPAIDLEGAVANISIPAKPRQAKHAATLEAITTRQPKKTRASRKGGKRTRQSSRILAVQEQPKPQPPTPQPTSEPPKNLKYMFGVNAWKQWVTSKNVDVGRSSTHTKQMKSDLLQLTSDELNYSLCLFISEVRKPNGQEYAPDTLYYLCLGIQLYLIENERMDNVFCDPLYEKFTDCLDEIARKFSLLYSDSQFIVTRVEEEHLWESKQLGAYSPYVLLSTLMFFNTKQFLLSSVEEHTQLSFSHIMKHWKRVPGNTARGSGYKNLLLRFYPPQSSELRARRNKRKVYEQKANEQNPLRCPVKLYEFYLSKCPESVRTRSDVFYLQPERSCVPDSPVWYSTSALTQTSLEKMLYRVKMVKEVNIELLNT